MFFRRCWNLNVKNIFKNEKISLPVGIEPTTSWLTAMRTADCATEAMHKLI
jgi:hypothetical protein